MTLLNRPNLRKNTLSLITGLVCVFLSHSALSDNTTASSSIQGPVTIQIDTGTIKNILSNSRSSSSTIHIGSVQNSKLKSVDIKVKVDEVNNIVENAVNSSARTNIGTISNTTANNAKIEVDVNRVNTKVLGGTNNNAITNIGVLEHAKIQGAVSIRVRANEVSNTIRGGSSNNAEVSIGYDPGPQHPRKSILIELLRKIVSKKPVKISKKVPAKKPVKKSKKDPTKKPVKKRKRKEKIDKNAANAAANTVGIGIVLNSIHDIESDWDKKKFQEAIDNGFKGTYQEWILYGRPDGSLSDPKTKFNKVPKVLFDLNNPQSLFGKNHKEIEAELEKLGYKREPKDNYRGKSDAYIFSKVDSKNNRSEIIVNYGGGSHTSKRFDSPVYYKISGSGQKSKTKIVDPDRYNFPNKNGDRKFLVIDGKTGDVIKHAGEIYINKKIDKR